MQFGPYQLKRCRYGWMLFTGPTIGKCFELYGQYSEEEVRLFRAFIKPGSTVLDIGANIGDLTVPLSQIVGDTGRVYAVESHSDVFNVLCANLALNNIKNTKPINAFVAEDDRSDTGGAWGQHGYVSATWDPTFMTVDSLCLESCDFIKIDVDGKELEVMRSARGTIARTRPMIYFENEDRAKSPETLDFLLQRDYHIFWHQPPVFEPDNFFGNPIDHWPERIMSYMMFCVPAEQAAGLSGRLERVAHKDEWWLQRK